MIGIPFSYSFGKAPPTFLIRGRPGSRCPKAPASQAGRLLRAEYRLLRVLRNEGVGERLVILRHVIPTRRAAIASGGKGGGHRHRRQRRGSGDRDGKGQAAQP